jgi:hypothetical protein
MRKKSATAAKATPAQTASSLREVEAAARAGGDGARPRVGEEEIRLRAYLKWEAAGRPAGDGARFWLEAERELLHGATLSA